MPLPALAAPGSLTVPPLAGWEGVVGGVLAVLVVAFAFFLLAALASGRRRRSPEWEAWLAGRSRSRLGGREPASLPRPADAQEGGARLP